MVSTELLSQKWKELGLPTEQLQEIMSVGSFVEEFEFMKFFAVACSHLGGKVCQEISVCNSAMYSVL